MSRTIGFIGLGKMGLPMALNLCRKGFAVLVCSSNPNSQSRVIAEGGGVIGGFQNMAQSCEVIITMVPADQEVLNLYTREGGICDHAGQGLICIDMTSAKGTTKKAIANHIERTGKDITFIDAPVSGGVVGAENGSLTIMAGCAEQELEQVRDILEAMGSNIIYTGEVGCGSNVKMLNQMLNAANTAIAAEVLCISRELGVSDAILSTVVNQSSGGSYVFERNVPRYMMSGQHQPGFRLELMKKDIGLFVDTANEIAGFAPIANLVSQIYQAASNHGYEEENYTVVHKWYEENQ